MQYLYTKLIFQLKSFVNQSAIIICSQIGKLNKGKTAALSRTVKQGNYLKTAGNRWS